MCGCSDRQSLIIWLGCLLDRYPGSMALIALRNTKLWSRLLLLLLLSHVLAWKLAYNWEGLLHTQFLLWYTMMAVFLLNLFLNFSPKKPKSLIVVVLTAQFSPNRVILIGGAQSCNTAQCGEWRSLVSKSKL